MKLNRKGGEFLKSASVLPLAAAAGLGLGGLSALAQTQPIKRLRGSMPKISLNAYSFSKMLNYKVKRHGPGIDLFELLDFCAKYNFYGFHATGDFFPGYPDLPPDHYV